ncbi:MAG: DNA mismatch repair protein MutS, partial [Nanoarchaeota archaeon]|nr:DNA mismatch repair protein MutS [Nanoarchaeota archaeon]
GLVRIVTPGTIIEDCLLDEKNNNYIFSIIKDKDIFGIAIADISTGEFLTSKAESMDKVISELNRFRPSECIIPLSQEDSDWAKSISQLGTIISGYDDRHYWDEKSKETIKEHFNVINLEGFDITNEEEMISASGALISYLIETQKTSLSHINTIKKFNDSEFMVLDASTQRNLELISNIRENSLRGTLISILDKTKTPMGSRLMKKWLLRPLIETKDIKKRQEAVEEFFDDMIKLEDIRENLRHILDIERLISRISYGSANARDLNALKRSLSFIPQIKRIIAESSSEILKNIANMDGLGNIHDIINKAIEDDPPLSLREGNLIKAEYDEELKKLKDITKNGKNYIASLEEKEQEKTGIKSLKIKYNRVFGYFIEVTKSNLHLVPQEYIRKQTQANCERYITDELKKQEELILGAEEKLHILEYNIFQAIIKQIAEQTSKIQQTAQSIAELDVIANLAKIAADNNYTKPFINEEGNIHIIDSRHPVLETLEDIYIPNDISIDTGNFIQIITGPNMAGKSSYMRQAALIIIMAQIGSFIPAAKASICTVDRIFTRVGAYDDLTMGQSTFMVEMTETANILNNATSKSFIVLDEIGRGTSTYDGVSLAWAIAEYIHDNIKAKTLFATHYHQMNKLAEKLEGIRNYNIAVKEKDDKIIFLRKIIEGSTDKSYGIQVAKLAGVPVGVIDRSKIIMTRLEMEDEIGEKIHAELKTKKKPVPEDKKKIKEKIDTFVQKSLLDI